MNRPCNDCSEELIPDINWSVSSVGKKRYLCKYCSAKRQRTNHSNNKEIRNKKQRERYRKNKATYLAAQKRNSLYRKYGLTPEQYTSLIKDKQCFLCGSNFRLCIDHCHITNKIRGVLCMNCNTGLGHFKDDIQLLEKAIAYLNKMRCM